MSETRDRILLVGAAVWVFWTGLGFFHVNPDPTLRVLWIVSGIFTLLLCILAAICQEDA
jgi:hypothetical protein